MTMFTLFNALLPFVFFASLAALAYFIARKIPALTQILPESLPDRETFFAFCARMAYNIGAFLKPRRIKIYVLSHVASALNKIRMFSLRVYYIIEMGAKKARQESQKMDWEHNWFSAKDIQEVNGEGEKASQGALTTRPSEAASSADSQKKATQDPQL